MYTSKLFESYNKGLSKALNTKLTEARSNKEANEKAAPRQSFMDKVKDGVNYGVYDDKDERNYADRYKEPINAKRNKVKNFTERKKGGEPETIERKLKKMTTHYDYEKSPNQRIKKYAMDKLLKEDSDVEELDKLQDELRGVNVSSLSDEEYKEYKKKAARVKELIDKIYNFTELEESCNKTLKEDVNDEVNQAWDTLINMGVSEETLQIITAINGYTLETLEDVLYAAYGYRSFDQLEDEEMDESAKVNK